MCFPFYPKKGQTHKQKLTPNTFLGQSRKVVYVRMRSTTTRDRFICIFGVPSPLDFFEFSPVDFFSVSLGFLCNLVRFSPQNVEKIARFLGRDVTSLAVMVFYFGSDYVYVFPKAPCGTKNTTGSKSLRR